jgi:hypothetical protein
MIATFEFTSNDCPSISISGRTICLLYLSKNKVDAASKRLLELNSDLIIKTDKSRVDQRFDSSKLKVICTINNYIESFEFA